MEERKRQPRKRKTPVSEPANKNNDSLLEEVISISGKNVHQSEEADSPVDNNQKKEVSNGKLAQGIDGPSPSKLKKMPIKEKASVNDKSMLSSDKRKKVAAVKKTISIEDSSIDKSASDEKEVSSARLKRSTNVKSREKNVIPISKQKKTNLNDKKNESSKDVDDQKRESAKDVGDQKSESSMEVDDQKSESTKEVDDQKSESTKEVDDQKSGSTKEVDDQKNESAKEVDDQKSESAKEVDDQKSESATEADDKKKEELPPSSIKKKDLPKKKGHASKKLASANEIESSNIETCKADEKKEELPPTSIKKDMPKKKGHANKKLASTNEIEASNTETCKAFADETVPSAPDGWTRVAVVRKTGKTAGLVDIYFYSPEGKKLRSRPEVASYIEKNKCDLKVEDFDFSKKITTAKKTKTTAKNNVAPNKKDIPHEEKVETKDESESTRISPKLSKSPKKASTKTPVDVEKKKNSDKLSKKVVLRVRESEQKKSRK